MRSIRRGWLISYSSVNNTIWTRWLMTKILPMLRLPRTSWAVCLWLERRFVFLHTSYLDCFFSQFTYQVLLWKQLHVYINPVKFLNTLYCIQGYFRPSTLTVLPLLKFTHTKFSWKSDNIRYWKLHSLKFACWQREQKGQK